MKAKSAIDHLKTKYLRKRVDEMCAVCGYICVGSHAEVVWTKAPHGFETTSARDDIIWQNIHTFAPQFTHGNEMGYTYWFREIKYGKDISTR
eukprot:COSAG01_NODE_931_length_12617_cov_20.567163_9_plen_92_part_00